MPCRCSSYQPLNDFAHPRGNLRGVGPSREGDGADGGNTGSVDQVQMKGSRYVR